MSDLIDRQSAIDALDEQFWRCLNIPICKEIRNVAKETIKALPSAQPEQKWIPCSERLPTEDGVYLIAYEALGGGYGYDADTFHQNENKFGWYNGDGEAIAWMPIPELYRGDNE